MNSPSSPPSPPRVPPAPALRHFGRKRIGDHLRNAFIAGAITLIPLFITIFVLRLIFNFLTGPTTPIANLIVEPLINLWWAAPKEGAADFKLYQNTIFLIQWTLALILTLAAVYLLGLASIFTIGRGLLAHMERFFEGLPLIKGIYGTVKQVISVFRHSGGGGGFQRVVLVEFPRTGTWTVAFVTNTLPNPPSGEPFVCCFIPMTPNPTSGFFQIFPASQVRDTDWSVDQGLKLVLSGGLLIPPNIPLPPSTQS